MVHKADSMRWKIELYPDLKKTWKKRAKKINRRNLLGKFFKIPWNTKSTKTNDTIKKKYLLKSFFFEWNELVMMFKRCVPRKPKSILISKS